MNNIGDLRAAVNATVDICVDEDLGDNKSSSADRYTIAMREALTFALSRPTKGTGVLCSHCGKTTSQQDLVGDLLAEAVNDRLTKQRKAMELTVIKLRRGEINKIEETKPGDRLSHLSDTCSPPSVLATYAPFWVVSKIRNGYSPQEFYLPAMVRIDAKDLEFNVISAFKKGVETLVANTLKVERILWEGRVASDAGVVYVRTPVISRTTDWYNQGMDAVGWYFQTIVSYVGMDPENVPTQDDK